MTEALAIIEAEIAVRKYLEAKDRIEQLEAALRWVSSAYRKAHPIQTADFHNSDCKCLRCAVDNARAALEGKKDG